MHVELLINGSAVANSAIWPKDWKQSDLKYRIAAKHQHGHSVTLDCWKPVSQIASDPLYTLKGEASFLRGLVSLRIGDMN